MGNIPPVGSSPALDGVQGTQGAVPAQQARQAETIKTGSGEDQVEISSLAQSLSAMESDADIRLDKVMAIREAIANGTYETPEKIEATVDKLMGILA